MTVAVESERHLHRPRVYITDATNMVSLYTLSHLLQCHQQCHIYYEDTEDTRDDDDELIKKICPRAIKQSDGSGMERSVVYLREGMDEALLKAPLEGCHKFVLIVSLAGIEEDSPVYKLECAAKAAGYESYCVLRLPPVYQDLSLIDVDEGVGEFYGIDAEDAGSAVSHILLDPDLHRTETYTIYSPSSVSPSTLTTVHSQLPHSPGPALQPPSAILEAVKSSKVGRNDFARITGGEEMTSFEEFLRRTHQSLFHQRFISRA